MIEAPSVTDPSMVYMYGISDFWVDMFADRELVEGILEESTAQLAEIYSYFLQRSAGISLENIQDRYQTRIRLLLVDQDDMVDPLDLTEFRVDPSITKTAKLSNRPILPTQTLDDGIHYEIRDGILRFNRPIDELRFPVRHTSDGRWQYAVWMCDVEINDKWIDDTFGRLVGFTEEDAIFNYKSFLEGVYYLYANGPNLSFIERGVNLAMGMPYARETEQVLDVSQDAASGNWIVFTTSQSYAIPYGYRPDIQLGDILEAGQVLTTWVEVRDYSTHGAWWYQIFIPREVLGEGVDSLQVGRAVKGSTGDAMMETFLKNHMFEVLITQPNSDITAYNTARDLVLRSRPEYTYPVFVWRAPIEDEVIELRDDFSYNYESRLQDYCVSPPSIRFMDRGVNDKTFSRGTNWYNRCQGSVYAASLIGYGDWPGNGGWAPQFENISEVYLHYMAVLMRTRGDRVSPTNRGTIIRGWRSVLNEYPLGISWRVDKGSVYGGDSADYEIDERELTPLYLMTRQELVEKMRTVSPSFNINGRNRFLVSGLNLPESYDLWMKRNVESITVTEADPYDFEYTNGGLDIAFSPFANQAYVPKFSDMFDGDDPITDGMILINRCTDSSWAVQWVRSDVSYAPTLFPVEDQDHLRGIESYRFSKLGNAAEDVGQTFNRNVDRVMTPRIAEGTQDTLVIIDGKYVSVNEYQVESQRSSAESPTQDPPYIELDPVSRSYIVLDTPPTSLGYVAMVSDASFMVTEETIEGSGTFTLSESVNRKEDILLVSDGKFIFDYTVSGDQLTTPASNVTVRYVSQRNEETLASGSLVYTLNEDANCKVFEGDTLLESWRYTRNGTVLTLNTTATNDLTIRYNDYTADAITSVFNRSTVESNQARFLMDRSRPDGEYEDFLGNTTFMNRSGTPTTTSGDDATQVNVIRRFR